MMPRHPFLLRFNLRVLKFSDPPAFQTDEMIMVVPPEPALVETVSAVKIVDIQDIVSGQKL